MNFQWPDPISFVADLVTFVGVPVLAYSTRGLYGEFKELRWAKGVSEDCVTFWDVDASAPSTMSHSRRRGRFRGWANMFTYPVNVTATAGTATANIRSLRSIFTIERTVRLTHSYRRLLRR